VRDHGELARLEIDSGSLAGLVAPGPRGRVIEALRDAGFSRACLDLGGYRRGALNEGPVDGTQRGPGREGGRIGEVEGGLLELGIAARVESGGADGEIAVLVGDGDAFAPLLVGAREAVVSRTRAAGFRYVALGLY
jgi:hypothetical protein